MPIVLGYLKDQRHVDYKPGKSVRLSLPAPTPAEDASSLTSTSHGWLPSELRKINETEHLISYLIKSQA